MVRFIALSIGTRTVYEFSGITDNNREKDSFWLGYSGLILIRRFLKLLMLLLTIFSQKISITCQHSFDRDMKYNVTFRAQCGHLAVTSGGLATHPIRYKTQGQKPVLLSTLVSIKMKAQAIVH
ncbi:MAG: hypothetical protein ACI9YO_003029 [Gammaproteobacteria bacterium]|jgi:hypothetical protein